MIEVSFVGDTCFNGFFENKLSNEGDIFDIKLLDFVKTKVFVCCNFEGPETNAINSNKKGTLLKNGKGAISYLRKNGIEIFNLANNHICDYGKQGLDDTLSEVAAKNGLFLGAGLSEKQAFEPLIIKQNNESLAIIAYAENEKPIAGKKSHGIAGIKSISRLQQQIAQLKMHHKWVILTYHGGEEFSVFPSPKKRKLLKKIATHTEIDAIVAHHSHTFQGIEHVGKKPIFYSIGNFVFDLENHVVFPHTSESAIVTLNCTDEGVSYTLQPTICDAPLGQVLLGNEDFLNEIKLRSDFNNYKSKWMKECYRIVFERPVHKTLNPEGQSLQKKSALLVFFTMKFYSRIYTILKNWKMRTLYFNAIYYKLMSKI